MDTSTARTVPPRRPLPKRCALCGGLLTRFESVSHRDDHTVCFKAGCARYGVKIGGLSRADDVLDTARRLLMSRHSVQVVRATFVKRWARRTVPQSRTVVELPITPGAVTFRIMVTSAHELDRLMQAAPGGAGQGHSSANCVLICPT